MQSSTDATVYGRNRLRVRSSTDVTVYGRNFLWTQLSTDAIAYGRIVLNTLTYNIFYNQELLSSIPCTHR